MSDHRHIFWQELRSTPVTIAGSARSGLAVAALLRAKGVDSVFLSDSGPVKPEAIAKLEGAGVEWEQNGHSERAMQAGWLVVSPGVPTQSDLVQTYLRSGRPVHSELEVASWFLRPDDRVVAITGTNGKTTVTSWIGDVFERAGIPSRVGGNIGTPLSALLLERERVPGAAGGERGADGPASASHTSSGTAESDASMTWVLEVSSFQLDHCSTFRPDVAVLLNITPDHMDRYGGSIEAYAASKFKLASAQRPTDTFIYNADDSRCSQFAARLATRPDAPRILGFSRLQEVEQGAWIRDAMIVLTTQHEEKETPLMPIDELGLPGLHNLHNGLATVLAARVSEIRSEVIRESLESFQGVAHRLEKVRTLDGVSYYNDSKATNVNSVWVALDSFNVPVTLILGGRDKGNDYSDLHDQLVSKVRAVVAIGESQDKIHGQLEGVVPDVLRAESMAEAVRLARRLAKRGEVVLLSPACSSFDMFDNYEHRGEVFKREVNSL